MSIAMPGPPYKPSPQTLRDWDAAVNRVAKLMKRALRARQLYEGDVYNADTRVTLDTTTLKITTGKTP